MSQQETKKKNVRNILTGGFFMTLSGVLFSFFLSLYLKRQGLEILEIGALFTAGLAIGSLITSKIFSEYLRKTKLKTGLYIAAFLNFLHTFLFYLFPTQAGTIASKIVREGDKSAGSISVDTALQHNCNEENKRQVKSNHRIIESLSLILGLALSVILVKQFGFHFSFLIFALLSIPAFLFFSRVKEETRFQQKTKSEKTNHLSKKLKLLMTAEMTYWFAMGSSLYLVITFLVTDKFQGSITWLAIIFGSTYLAMLVSVLLTRKKLDKSNMEKSSIIGMAIMLIGTIGIIISTNIYFALGAFILEGLGAGIWSPSKTALTWKNTQPENREKVSGHISGYKGFLQALGPLTGGALASIFGILGPFYFKAILSIVPIAIYSYILSKESQN